MAGKYSVPKEIRDLCPKGAKAKNIGGKYYAYECKSTSKIITHEDGTKSKKSITKWGSEIGLITLQDGFIPNNNYLADDIIRVKNFGSYYVALFASSSVLESLKEFFNAKDANRIYVIAIIFFVEKFQYMKNIKRCYELSYLSVIFSNIALSDNSLRNFYSDLGIKTDRVREFEAKVLDDSSGKLAVDGHVITCCSSHNDLSEYGYAYKKYHSQQVNWVTVFDAEAKNTILSHFYNGANPDMVSLKDMFNEYHFSGKYFLLDRGFNTQPNRELMISSGNTFVMPLISGRNDYNYVIENLKFDKRRYFTYTNKNRASMVYYREFTYEGRRFVAYQDTVMAASDEENYKQAIKKGVRGFTEEGLQREKDTNRFGLIILETNIPEDSKSSEVLYLDYKQRWNIETYYDYVRNGLDFNALCQHDYHQLQGLSFLVTVSGMIYHNVKKRSKETGVSFKELMDNSRAVKIVDEKSGDWRIENTPKPVREILKEFGISLTKYISDLQ